jgi:sugar phosphate isomerase/epimerase
VYERKIAISNDLDDVADLLGFAHRYKFEAIDWSFRGAEDLPLEPLKRQSFITWMKRQNGIDIRYHCAIIGMEFAHVDPDVAKHALETYKALIQIISEVGGRFITVHIGLQQPSGELLSWKSAMDNLHRLVEFGEKYGVKVCLENLIYGWTSQPDRFKELIVQSGAGVTFDIGHVYCCEAVKTGKSAYSDFIDSVKDRVFNAHIYHSEPPGVGHVPPRTLEDILPRLELLMDAKCYWWVIELPNSRETLHTNSLLQDFLSAQHADLSPDHYFQPVSTQR